MLKTETFSTRPDRLRPRKATAVDLPSVAATLALAFYDDPVVTWCVEDGSRRRQLSPTVLGEICVLDRHRKGLRCVEDLREQGGQR